MKYLNYNKKIIAEVCDVLKKGGLVVFPSDTVYGMLVDASNKEAVAKLITFKNRPPGKAISVFVSDYQMIKKYAEVSYKQEKILKELLPGPFTIILKSKHKTCREIESEKGTLGIRIPKNNSINQLVEHYGKPLTATSANLTGRPANYSVVSFLKSLTKEKKELIDLVVDIGQLPRNKPSTVVDLSTSDIKIIRQGDINFLRSNKTISSSEKETKKIAQDILKSNLTTDKPLFIILQGDLGVGKTIFVKGIGEYLGIRNIISPSYVIYYEYKAMRHCINTMMHADFYNIEEEKEIGHLGLEKYFKKGNVICFEWGEKLGSLYKTLRKKGKVVEIKLSYVDERRREVQIKI